MWKKKSFKKWKNQQNDNNQVQTTLVNIVPSMMNEVNDEEYQGDLENVIDVEDVQVTSSFAIPLPDRLDKNYKKSKATMAFQHELDAKCKATPFENYDFNNKTALIALNTEFRVPKAIQFEIKMQHIRQILFGFIGFLGILITSFFLIAYFKNFNFKVIHPIITIPLLIFSTALLLLNIIDYFQLKKEIELYIKRTLKGTLAPPNFIINIYRRIHVHLIAVNWFCFITYFYFSIAMGFMFLLSEQRLTFIIQSWTIDIPNLYYQAYGIALFLSIVFTLQMINLVFFKYRKSNILGFYGYEIIHPEQLALYKKRMNRCCFFIFLIITSLLFFAIAIPLWILRVKKKRTIIKTN